MRRTTFIDGMGDADVSIRQLCLTRLATHRQVWELVAKSINRFGINAFVSLEWLRGTPMTKMALAWAVDVLQSATDRMRRDEHFCNMSEIICESIGSSPMLQVLPYFRRIARLNRSLFFGLVFHANVCELPADELWRELLASVDRADGTTMACIHAMVSRAPQMMTYLEGFNELQLPIDVKMALALRLKLGTAATFLIDALDDDRFGGNASDALVQVVNIRPNAAIVLSQLNDRFDGMDFGGRWRAARALGKMTRMSGAVRLLRTLFKREQRSVKHGHVSLSIIWSLIEHCTIDGIELARDILQNAPNRSLIFPFMCTALAASRLCRIPFTEAWSRECTELLGAINNR